MSVKQEGLICPVSDHKSKLKDIEQFISELVKTEYILDKVIVITGEADKVKNIQLGDFEYSFSVRGVDKLLPNNGLELMTKPFGLSEQGNYAFRIMLSPKNSESAKLTIT